MYRIFTQTALTAAFAVFASGQEPRAQDPAASAASAAAGTQSYRGILMDATCQAIQNKGASTLSSGTASADITRTRTTEANTSDLPRSTASAAAASTTRTTPTTSSTTTATTGVATDQSGQATATNRTTPQAERSTTNSVTTHTGTAGSSPQQSLNSASVDSNVGSTAGTTVAGSTATEQAAATGERSRAVATHTSPDAQWTTVREKYKDCKVTPATTSFAIMSNGQLYMIDDSSGSLRQRMSSNASSDWHTLTVMGNMTGDRITVSSIQ